MQPSGGGPAGVGHGELGEDADVDAVLPVEGRLGPVVDDQGDDPGLVAPHPTAHEVDGDVDVVHHPGRVGLDFVDLGSPQLGPVQGEQRLLGEVLGEVRRQPQAPHVAAREMAAVAGQVRRRRLHDPHTARYGAGVTSEIGANSLSHRRRGHDEGGMSEHQRTLTLPSDPFRTAVRQAMADIVAGDPAATWRLRDLCGPAVRAMAYREGRRIGVWLSADDLDEIQIDVALDLARRAPSWDPEGSYPWTWAKRSVLAMGHAHIGQFGEELDDVEDAAEPEPVDRLDDPVAVLLDLADHHPRVTALLHHLGGASDRDVAIWVGYRLEVQAGNRRPAVTVGADHSMKPAAVRKVVQRVNQRLATAGSDLGLAA